MAAIGPLTVDGQPVGRWAPFFVFLTATPILVWVAFATKLRAAGKPLPASPQRWPIWEMIAATLAYLAWTFALPNTPFAQNTVRIGIFDGVSGEGLFCRQGSACNASVRRGKETSGRQERRDYLGLSPDRLRDQPMKTQYNFAGGKRGVVNAALREYVGAKREPLEATLRRVLREELPHDLKRTASR